MTGSAVSSGSSAARIGLFIAGCVGVSAALAQDGSGIFDLISDTAACAAIGELRADMPVEPAYTLAGGECTAIDPRDAGADTALYVDRGCLESLDFEPTTLQSWCAAARNARELGEATDLSAEPEWTLNPGTRMDLGARSLDGVFQPWTKRLRYRTVTTDGGVCELELRVYKRHPDATGEHSLLAFHGGSWSSRLFGFLGLEFTVAHFVEQGFVVYAPFYRLLGDSDGSTACNSSSIDDIVGDAEAALEWVRENADTYGSNPTPVVFGQSAGGQLAASLAFNQPEAVRGAVLFYPPVDFADFVLRARSGRYTNSQGLDILELVLNDPLAEVDVSASPIPENTFPARVAGSRMDYPPVFLLHGAADELVEDRQSVRLCDALAGRALIDQDEAVASLEDLREIVSCTAGTAEPEPVTLPPAEAEDVPVSRLHRIREGQHALDFCFAPTLLFGEACRSGSEASRDQVAASIGEAVAFAVRSAQAVQSGEDTGSDADAPDDDDDAGLGSSGLHGLAVLALVLLRRIGATATSLPLGNGSPVNRSDRTARAIRSAKSHRYQSGR